MEIIFWVMISFILLLIVTIAYLAEQIPKDVHHDSRPGSFYEISNRKDKTSSFKLNFIINLPS